MNVVREDGFSFSSLLLTAAAAFGEVVGVLCVEQLELLHVKAVAVIITICYEGSYSAGLYIVIGKMEPGAFFQAQLKRKKNLHTSQIQVKNCYKNNSRLRTHGFCQNTLNALHSCLIKSEFRLSVSQSQCSFPFSCPSSFLSVFGGRRYASGLFLTLALDGVRHSFRTN